MTHIQYNTIQYDTHTVQFNMTHTVQYNMAHIQCNTIRHTYSTIQYNMTHIQYNTIQHTYSAIHCNTTHIQCNVYKFHSPTAVLANVGPSVQGMRVSPTSLASLQPTPPAKRSCLRVLRKWAAVFPTLSGTRKVHTHTWRCRGVKLCWTDTKSKLISNNTTVTITQIITSRMFRPEVFANCLQDEQLTRTSELQCPASEYYILTVVVLLPITPLLVPTCVCMGAAIYSTLQLSTASHPCTSYSQSLDSSLITIYSPNVSMPIQASSSRNLYRRQNVGLLNCYQARDMWLNTEGTADVK